jgi:hypothetical protein
MPHGLAKICLFRRCTGMWPSGVPGIVFSSFCWMGMLVVNYRDEGKQRKTWGYKRDAPSSHTRTGSAVFPHPDIAIADDCCSLGNPSAV